MKNRRGEIATIITLAVMGIIGVTAVVSSLGLNKKTSTSARASGVCASFQCSSYGGATYTGTAYMKDNLYYRSSSCPAGTGSNSGWKSVCSTATPTQPVATQPAPTQSSSDCDFSSELLCKAECGSTNCQRCSGGRFKCRSSIQPTTQPTQPASPTATTGSYACKQGGAAVAYSVQTQCSSSCPAGTTYKPGGSGNTKVNGSFWCCCEGGGVLPSPTPVTTGDCPKGGDSYPNSSGQSCSAFCGAMPGSSYKSTGNGYCCCAKPFPTTTTGGSDDSCCLTKTVNGQQCVSVYAASMHAVDMPLSSCSGNSAYGGTLNLCSASAAVGCGGGTDGNGIPLTGGVGSGGQYNASDLGFCPQCCGITGTNYVNKRVFRCCTSAGTQPGCYESSCSANNLAACPEVVPYTPPVIDEPTPIVPAADGCYSSPVNTSCRDDDVRKGSQCCPRPTQPTSLPQTPLALNCRPVSNPGSCDSQEHYSTDVSGKGQCCTAANPANSPTCKGPVTATCSGGGTYQYYTSSNTSCGAKCYGISADSCTDTLANVKNNRCEGSGTPGAVATPVLRPTANVTLAPTRENGWTTSTCSKECGSKGPPRVDSVVYVKSGSYTDSLTGQVTGKNILDYCACGEPDAEPGTVDKKDYFWNGGAQHYNCVSNYNNNTLLEAVETCDKLGKILITSATMPWNGALCCDK